MVRIDVGNFGDQNDPGAESDKKMVNGAVFTFLFFRICRFLSCVH